MSAPVKEWIARFRARHTQVVPRSDWPPQGSEYWDAWFRGLCAINAAEADANAASDAMATAAPKYLSEQLAEFLNLVRGLAERRAAAGAMDRDDAARQSAGCPWCSGGRDDTNGVTFAASGLATVVRIDGEPFATKTTGGHPVKLPHLVMACVCPLGRWTLARHGAKCPFPDLARWQGHVEPINGFPDAATPELSPPPPPRVYRPHIHGPAPAF